jgi:hypothetical protein
MLIKNQITIPVRASICKLTPFVVYAMTFLLPIPHSIGRAIRQGWGLEIILMLLLLIGGLLPTREQQWVSPIPIFFLFGAGLAALWSIPLSEGQVVGGMLYFSDSSRYYADALRLLNGIHLSNFSGRHPLPTLFLSMLLWITGKNIKLSMAVITVLAAWVTWLAVREVKKNWGPIPAAFFCVLLFLFYRRVSGLTDSENLGYIFGCLAFTIFIQSLRAITPWFFGSGLLALSLGLTARPGTFLVLPAILIWRLKKTTRPDIRCFEILLIWFLVIGIAYIFNCVLDTFAADKNSRLFSNFSYTFYGMTQGGKGWEQFHIDHPEYSNTTEIDAERGAMLEGLKTLSQNPILTLQGMAHAYQDFFSLKPISVFGFLGYGPSVNSLLEKQISRQWVSVFLRSSAIIFALFGIIFLWRNRENQVNKFLLWIIAGIICSVPFLPPIDAGMMRVYMTTIPFILILPVIGIYSFLKADHNEELPCNQEKISLAMISGTSLILSLFLGAFAFIVSGKPHTINEQYCSIANSKTAVFDLNRGSYLRLVSDEQSSKSNTFDISFSDFHSSYAFFPHMELVAPLNSIPSDTLLMNTINLIDGQQLWVILPLSTEKSAGNRIGVCGIWDQEFYKIGLGFLYVKNASEFEKP